jgi:hypothetical protein
VPVFDDGISEVERSVNEISTQISTTNSMQLSEKIKRTEKLRMEIINLLNEQRKKCLLLNFENLNR